MTDAVMSVHDIRTAARQQGKSIAEFLNANRRQIHKRIDALSHERALKEARERHLREMERKTRFSRSWANMVQMAAIEHAAQKRIEWYQDDSIQYLGPIAEGATPFKLIRHQVCTKYNITAFELDSRRRTKLFVQARFEVSWRARRETSLSYPSIAERIGVRNHTTVIHGCQTYERWQRVKAGLEAPRQYDSAVNFDLIIGRVE